MNTSRQVDAHQLLNTSGFFSLARCSGARHLTKLPVYIQAVLQKSRMATFVHSFYIVH